MSKAKEREEGNLKRANSTGMMPATNHSAGCAPRAEKKCGTEDSAPVL